MRYFDLHCDTIYESLVKACDISNPDFHITPRKSDYLSPYIQCFAICVPEEHTGDRATYMFKAAYYRLIEQCEKFNITVIKNYDDIKTVTENGGKGAIFTVENASVLAGKLENIELFKEFNVKFVTLTWNGRNELGDGAMVSHSNGITPFGIKVIKELDKNNITVDVSHTSDRLFYDIISHSSKPIVATHSNSRVITNVKRNLTDEQFDIIKNKNGVVGLNLHKYFLNNNPEQASAYDILKHAEHFLSLGGENVLAFGADFDGCELPDDISGIDYIGQIYELFLKHNYSEKLIEKIFYENAYKFCENFDKY
ncbi:MAG: membrane dipeptidase [Ruminococcus sp.]|nr:membrane dipeptidase [Ruminococcus sp.]